MPRSLAQAPVPGEAASRVQCRNADQRTSASRCIRAVAIWIERSRQRRAIKELARLNSRYLEDIGVSKDEALREASKPFWQR